MGDVDKCDIFRRRPAAKIYWVIAKTNSVSKFLFVNVLYFFISFWSMADVFSLKKQILRKKLQK